MFEWMLIKGLPTTPANAWPQQDRLQQVGMVLLVLLTLAAAMPPYLSNLASSMNSDHLILADLYESLVRRGESWSSWAMGGALFLFPDGAVFFPMAALLGDTYLTVLMQTGLWIILLWSGFFLLGRARVGHNTNRAMGWFLLLFLLATHTAVWPRAAALWKVLYHPVVHGGGYLVIVASMLLVYIHLRDRRKWSLVLLALMCIGGTGSDLLYCVYFTLPCLIALAAMAVVNPGFRHRVIPPSLTILLATWFSRFLLPWITPGSHAEISYVSQFGPGTAWKTALFMADDLVSHGHWMIVGSILVSFAAAAWMLLGLFPMLRGKSPFSWETCYLDLSAVLALAGGWAALLFTGNYVDGWSWRYVIFPSTLVMVMVVWGAAPRLPRWACIIGFAASMVSLAHGFSMPKLDRPYPELARFLDDYNKNDCKENAPLVLGSYWTARKTTFQSRGGIRVEQICKDGHFYHWVNSLETFRRIKEDPTRVALVIMDGLEPAQIQAAYGIPTEQKPIDGNLIYFYAPPQSLQVIRTLTQNLP